MSQIEKTRELLDKNPASFVRKQIEDFVCDSPTGRLSFIDDYVIWDKPLVRYAAGDDPIFSEYKKIIGPGHLTPREALAKAYGKSPEDMPTKLTVISWILPIVEETRKSNRKETKTPSRLWCHTRWYGEKCNEALRRHLIDLLTSHGYLAAAPAIQPYFKVERNEKGAFSNWSERHIAFAAGHGTFGLSDGLITERGMAHRCGSVVTSLVIPASPRTAKSPYSNCLHYKGIKCEKCVTRCPVGAISEKGHDKVRCSQYVDEILGYYKSLKEGYNNDKSSAGCGLCQTKTPCEFQNPAAKLKNK